MNWDWNSVLADDRFKALAPDEQRKVADTYFKQTVEPDERYRRLGTGEKIKVQQTFLHSIGQEPDTVGGFSAPIRSGIANLSGLISLPLRFVGNYMPTEEEMQTLGFVSPITGSLSKEDFFEAAQFVDELGNKFRPVVTETGRFAKPTDWGKWNDPTDPTSPFNLKRLVSKGTQYAPMTLAFGAASIANPMLATLWMSATEGGQVAQSIQEYEEATGQKVPAWQSKLGVLAVGAINGQLEKIGAEALVGKLFKGQIASRLMNVLLAAPTEGFTEALQQGTQVLVESGFAPRTSEQAMIEILESFYGGVAGAFISSPITFATSGPETKKTKSIQDIKEAESIPQELVVEGLTPEIVARVASYRFQTAKSKGSKAEVEALRQEKEDITALYTKAVPSDVDGTGIDAYIEMMGIKKKKAPKLTDEFVQPLPNDLTVNMQYHSARVKLDFVQRATTALGWMAKVSPASVARIKKVVLVSGSQTAWLDALSQHIGFKDFQQLLELGDKTARSIAEAQKRNGSFFFPDGTVLVRDLPKGASKTGKFVNYFGHEVFHAEMLEKLGPNHEGKLSKQEEEKLAEAAGWAMMTRFGKEAASTLEFQRVENDDQLQRLSEAVLATDEQTDAVMEQRIAEHLGSAVKASKIDGFNKLEAAALEREDLPDAWEGNLPEARTVSTAKGLFFTVQKDVSYMAANRLYNALRWVEARMPRSVKRPKSITLLPDSNIKYADAIARAAYGKGLNDLPQRLAFSVFEQVSDAAGTQVNGHVFIRVMDTFEELSKWKKGFATVNPEHFRESFPAGHYRRLWNTTSAYVNVFTHELMHALDFNRNSLPNYTTRTEITTYGVISNEAEARADVMGIDASVSFLLTGAKSSMEFQTYVSNRWASPKQIIRLLNSTHLFNNVYQSSSQLYNSQGEAVNAAVDTATGNLYLSPHVNLNTIGHEATELMLKKLGPDHPVVKRGLELFGNKEELSDAVGQYYAGELDATMVQKLGRWLQELWAAVKETFGLELTQTDVMALINQRINGEANFVPAGSVEFQRQALGKTMKQIVEERQEEPTGVLKKVAVGKTSKATKEEAPKQTHTREQGFSKKQKAYYGKTNNANRKKAASNINMKTKAWDEKTKDVNWETLIEYAKKQDAYHDVDAMKAALAIIADKGKIADIVERLNNNESVTIDELNAFLMMYTSIGTWNAVAKGLAADNPTQEVQAQAETAEEMFQQWTKVHSLVNYKLGYMLRAVGVMGTSPITFAALNKLISESNPKQRQFLIQQLAEGKPAKALTEEDVPPKFWEYLYTVMYSGILSGASIVTNFVNNAVWMTYLLSANKTSQAIADKILHTPLGKKLYPTISTKQRDVMLRDVAAGWRGAWRGASLAQARMAEAWRTGMIPDELRIKDEHGHGYKDMGIAKNPFSHPLAPEAFKKPLFRTKYGDVTIASIFGAPFKTLMATDVFFRSMAMDAYLTQYRERIAAETGVRAEDVQITDEVFAKAHEFGAHAVFMDPPGRLTHAANSTREAIPFGLGRAVIPFINTLANLLKRGVERLPIAGYFTMKTDRMAGNYAKVWAAQIEGTIATFLFLALFDKDNLTGAPPDDPNERDAFYRQGKQPYAFRVGDTWISYRRMDPFNIIISNLCAFRDALATSQDDDATLTKRFENLAYAVAENITQSSFASNMMTIMTDEGKFNNWLNRLPSSFVPYNALWRGLNSTIEAMQEGGKTLNDQNTMLSYMADSIPFGEHLASGLLGTEMPERLDNFGQVTRLPGGALQQWLPVKWRNELHDPVELELEELGIYPGKPSKTRTINGRSFALDDKMYWQYCQAYGSATKAAIADVIRRPSYLRLNDEQRRKFIARATGFARRRVQTELDRTLRQLYRTEAQGSLYNTPTL